MPKDIKNTEKEMTVTEVGTLVLGLVEKVGILDSKFNKLDEKIDAVEIRLIRKIEDSEELIMRTTAKGFAEVHEKFEQVDKHFEVIDRRFERVDKRFDEIDVRFEDVDESIRKVQNDIWNLNEKFVTRNEFQNFKLKTG